MGLISDEGQLGSWGGDKGQLGSVGQSLEDGDCVVVRCEADGHWDKEGGMSLGR